MTPRSLSRKTDSQPPMSPVGPTLADVLERVPSLEGVAAQARRNMASSIRAVCRVVNRHPSMVSITPRVIRNIFEQAQPAAADLSPSRWKNVKSDVRRAIRLSGLVEVLHGDAAPLTEHWQQLMAKVVGCPQSSLIRRFAEFCSGCQIEPEAVSAHKLDRYLAFLEETRFYKDPGRSLYVLSWAWNKHVAVDPSGDYPRLNAANRSRKYALDWADLPKLLYCDVAAFHERCAHPDPLAHTARRPASPVTIKNRDYLLRRYAAALVERGIDKNDLRTLREMFRLDRLKVGLRFFLLRNDNETCGQIVQILNLALVIGRRWTDLPAAEIDELKGLVRRLRHDPKGLTEKNRGRLRQFADDAALQRLLGLPQKLLSEAGKPRSAYRNALKVQMAVAIEVLTIAPIRIGNLVKLDFARHFHWARFEGRRVLHLVIPAADVKNDVDLEFPLPDQTTELLVLYMKTYQPALINQGSSSLLFPGRNGGPKSQSGLSRQISAIIKRETGLLMNAHLFRHLAALLFLERHPGHYEEVRRVLGHKRIETTLANYAGLETAAAVRRFDEMILERREKAPMIPARRRKQR